MMVVPLASRSSQDAAAADEDMQIDPDSPRDAPKKGQKKNRRS